jgi:hypothetical protein
MQVFGKLSFIALLVFGLAFVEAAPAPDATSTAPVTVSP